MLFTNMSDDNLLTDYFNMSNNNGYSTNMKSNQTTEVLSPRQGLNLGNMFASEYDRYKNYRPKELKADNPKEAMLLRIRELSFAMNDLNLKLDLDPNNQDYFNLFKSYAKELNNLMNEYAEKYDILELNQDVKNNYTWFKNPWPWEVDKYV